LTISKQKDRRESGLNRMESFHFGEIGSSRVEDRLRRRPEKAALDEPISPKKLHPCDQGREVIRVANQSA
jgi:hypothetical protein